MIITTTTTTHSVTTSSMHLRNVRFIIAALTTLSAYAVYMSRVNLSIAIIAMVEDRHAKATDSIEPSKQAQSQPQHDQDNYQQQRPFLAGNANYSSLAAANPQLLNGSDPSWLSKLTPEADSVTGAQASRANQSLVEMPGMFIPSKTSLQTPLLNRQKFLWNLTEQGHILGAFFYGYILFQIPGARMAESVGARWILMTGTFGSALISLAFPLSTQLNSIHLLMMLRFVMGLCQSAFFPAAYVLFCRWLPERERSVLLPVMFIGGNMGSISTYIMSSYLITSDYGWPSVFHLSGLVCLLVSLGWLLVGSNGPDDNWLITDKERHFIMSNVNNQSSKSSSLDSIAPSSSDCSSSDNQILGQHQSAAASKAGGIGLTCTTSIDIKRRSSCNKRAPKNHDNDNDNDNDNYEYHHDEAKRRDTLATMARYQALPPEPSWPKLLKSVPIWTLILSMYGNEWSNVVLCYELPSYLNTALSYPIEQNGVINSFFQLSYAVSSPIMSSLGAYMLNNHVFGMHKIHVRKLFQSLATFGQLLCFASVPICGANEGLIIMFMFASIVLRSCANAGDIMVPGDLSPEYAGTIFAFANSVGNTAGFFVPLLAGVFVHDAYNREQWAIFWFTSASIMGISGLIFLVFGETSRQDFSVDEPDASDRIDHVFDHHKHHRHMELDNPAYHQHHLHNHPTSQAPGLAVKTGLGAGKLEDVNCRL